jgi:hypothetical protein
MSARRGEREKGKKGKYAIVSMVVIVLGVLSLACGPNPNILNSGKETPAPVTGERPVSSLEKDIESMRTANLQYVFVLRRKDGGKLDTDDKAFIRQNKPAEINRIFVSDEEKAVVAGSNFPFPPEAFKLLQARFNIEDLSTSANVPAETNVNSNVTR